MQADLHIHSTFSDSSRTPEEVAEVARIQGVGLLSICDHGTTAGYGRLQNACRAEGIACVLGIELGADLDGQDYHMLAYNFDLDDTGMQAFIAQQHHQSVSECEDMIARMALDYPTISVEDYRAWQPPPDIGGWKYLHYAVARGAFATYEEANQTVFPRYFKAHPETWPVEDFCAQVKNAGGVPVLAHPGSSCPDDEAFPAMLHAMLERGIGGVECYYPAHSPTLTETCLSFCRQNGLCITAGSDCHGSYDPTPGYTIGALGIDTSQLALRGIL